MRTWMRFSSFLSKRGLSTMMLPCGRRIRYEAAPYEFSDAMTRWKTLSVPGTGTGSSSKAAPSSPSCLLRAWMENLQVCTTDGDQSPHCSHQQGLLRFMQTVR